MSPWVEDRALAFAIHVIRWIGEYASTSGLGAHKEYVVLCDTKHDGVRPGALQRTVRCNPFLYANERMESDPKLPCKSVLLRPCGNALLELLGKPDHDALGAANVGEPIRVLVLHHFADQFGAVGEQARDDVV